MDAAVRRAISKVTAEAEGHHVQALRIDALGRGPAGSPANPELGAARSGAARPRQVNGPTRPPARGRGLSGPRRRRGRRRPSGRNHHRWLRAERPSHDLLRRVPQSRSRATRPVTAPTPGRRDRPNRVDPVGPLVGLPGGPFLMGTDDPDGFPADGEGPVRHVTLSAFAIDPHATCNVRFAEFVDATGYRTDAERYGWSFVFAGLLPRGHPPRGAVPQAPWWRQVHGANWQHPEGPGSSVTAGWTTRSCTCPGTTRRRTAGGPGRGYRPRRSGSTPPAATSRRHGTPGATSWSPTADGGATSGRAPSPATTAWPTGSSAPRRSMRSTPTASACTTSPGTCGNGARTGSAALTGRRDGRPAGPPAGESQVIRGGSYLCHDSYCNRYRVAARTANTPDSSTGNMGFRCAVGE